jgi:NADH:ubiquinone reductase (H+-translocating)
MAKKRVVILGGGFGGLYSAKRLLHSINTEVEVILIDRDLYFTFSPMLHEVATGGLCGHVITTGFHSIFRSKRFKMMQDEVLAIDRTKREVKLKKHNSQKYDYLIIATGAATTFRNTPGAADYSFSLKTLDDAYKMRTHLINSAAEYCHAKKSMQESLRTVVICGAGPTGIEIAGEVKEYMDQMLKPVKSRVILLERSGTALQQFPNLRPRVLKKIKKNGIELRSNAYVKKISKDTVHLKDGTKISASTIIWAGGVAPVPVASKPAIKLDRDKVVVENTLRTNDSRVFAVGDISLCIPKGHDRPLPALAQVASKQGEHAAKNILRHISKRPLIPFHYDLAGVLISVGRYDAVGIVHGIPVGGFIAWWAKRTAYLIKMTGIGKRCVTAIEWTVDLLTKRDASPI